MTGPATGVVTGAVTGMTGVVTLTGTVTGAGTVGGTGTVTLACGPAGCRTRVALVRPGTGRLVVDEHLRVRLPAAHPWPSLADVLYGAGQGPGDAAELAARHPGALVVAVHRGRDCWLRLGPEGVVLRLTSRRTDPGAPWGGWGLRASLAHAWLVAGLPAEALRSARVRPPRGQSGAARSSRSTRVRTARASAESARPAAAYRSRASR